MYLVFEALRAASLFLLLFGAAYLARRRLIRRTGRPAMTLLLCASLALCLAMTLPVSAGFGVLDRAAQCVSTPGGDVAAAVRGFGSRGLEDVMNVLLWVFPGLFGVLAVRRPVLVVAGIGGAFVLVEFLQTIDPGRECDPGDWAYNSAGVLAGALAALAALRLRAATVR